MITALQCVKELGAGQLGQPGQGELVSSQQRSLGGDPRIQVRCPQAGRVVLAEQPAVVEPAQSAAADLFPVAAGDSAVAAAGKRPGAGNEHLDQLGRVLAPGPLMPHAQAPAVQLALAAGHQAGGADQRAAQLAAQRRGVELLPADPGGQPRPSAAVAAAVVIAGGDRAAGRGARPRRGPVAAQIAGAIRNWPDSPASNPGGVNRSQRGSDS